MNRNDSQPQEPENRHPDDHNHDGSALSEMDLRVRTRGCDRKADVHAVP
jgi:hypothetical protein